jgi:hypothetical protein
MHRLKPRGVGQALTIVGTEVVGVKAGTGIGTATGTISNQLWGHLPVLVSSLFQLKRIKIQRNTTMLRSYSERERRNENEVR